MLNPAIFAAVAAIGRRRVSTVLDDRTIRMDFSRMERQDGACALARFDAEFYVAGVPDLAPMIRLRPTVLGAVTRTNLRFAPPTPRYIILREGS